MIILLFYICYYVFIIIYVFSYVEKYLLCVFCFWFGGWIELVICFFLRVKKRNRKLVCWSYMNWNYRFWFVFDFSFICFELCYVYFFWGYGSWGDWIGNFMVYIFILVWVGLVCFWFLDVVLVLKLGRWVKFCLLFVFGMM